MKKILIICVGLLLSINMFAITRLLSKKVDLNDFPSRTTMLVLPNDNSMVNLFIKDAMKDNWDLSPYELCTIDNFEKIKTDTTFYFLIKVNGMQKLEDEATMEFLTLVKGGPKAEKGINAMDEIISLPLQSIGDESGKVLSYIPAYMRIIQAHVVKTMKDNLSAFSGLSVYNKAIDTMTDREILFSKEDIGYNISDVELNEKFMGMAKFVPVNEIENALENRTAKSLISLVINPNVVKKGSYSYKMIISTDTQELFFFRKHKITSRKPAGFNKEDIKRLSTPYQLNNVKK